MKKRNIFLLGCLLVSLVLLLGILGLNFRRTYRNARNDVIELSKSSSAQNAESIEMFFVRHEDVLLTTAEMLEYKLMHEDANLADVERLLRNISVAYNKNIYKTFTDKDFTGIYAAIDGVLVHGLKTPADLPEGYDPLKRQWYREGVSGKGEVVFGEPYRDIYTPYMVMTATKLLADKQTVIAMDITLEDLQYAGGKMDVTVTLNGKEHIYGYGFVLTDDGVVMAHKNEEEQEKCYNDPDSPMYDIFRKIVQCTSDELDYFETDIDGVNYGVFPHKLSNGWYVVTLTDLQDIRTSISDFSELILVGTAVVIFLSILYCIFILRAYTKSEKLTENLIDALDLAKVDALTGLGNRTAYDMRVREFQENLRTGNDQSFILVMMDLNDLKYINDTFGHATGDQYIRNSCGLVRRIFDSEIYRFGGDEFALFLTGRLFDNWEELYDRLKREVAEANLALTPSVDKPSISIGMAIHIAGNDDMMDSLLRKADAEMYTNKVAIKQARLEHSEKGYTPDLKIKLMDKQMFASEMKRGLEEEQFEVWLQPQVNHAKGGEPIGAEALVRWNHPKRGMVSPAVFIPMFEYNGLIYELDKYVWKHACGLIRRWLDSGKTVLPVSVNISRLDIIQSDFIETITSIVEEENIPYDLIHLEVTESAFSDSEKDVVQIVKNLIDRGFTVAIDDFGSGYSSLSLLRRLPAHILKLDMRFFADQEDEERNECIIRSIVRMAKMLGMAPLAEGVEHEEQANLLRALGCDYVQGYFYSKPLSYDEYMEYIEKAENASKNAIRTKTQEEVEEEKAKSRELFHNIISGTNDVIIVADIKTKQLLYANRAAERFYGKSFDPMNITTCSEYCGKKDICKNCPIGSLKYNERKEVTISENGTHMRGLYTRMNWNGHDAFVLYQTDISAETRKMEFANTLLNNLGMGIVIFRGGESGELKPIFCNREFKQLSGMSGEEFLQQLTRERQYGIHPNDFARAQMKFAEALHTNHPITHRLRVLKKPSNRYEWVSMHANIRQLESGGYEVYAVFTDAQEAAQKQLIDTERYRNYIQQTSKNASKDLSVVHLNLTKETCHSIHRDLSVIHPPVFSGDGDAFLSSVKQNVAHDYIREEFVKRFCAETLRANYNRGIFSDEIEVPIRLSDQRVIWCYQAARISKNPSNGDLEAILTLREADKDIRLAEYYQRIILSDYELVGSIDVETGLVTIISEPISHGLTDLSDSAVHYMKNLDARMKALVDDAFVDSAIHATGLDTVLQQLQSDGDYICSFPAKESLAGADKSFRWRFGYTDESRTEILFSRDARNDYYVC